MQQPRPIGVFDSGYGGLTVLKQIMAALPKHDYVYLGDNARAPYGNRSFETVYHYTLQCVKWLFAQDCPLVILACNTASAKALRTIQQNDLPAIDPEKRVLGVLRPTTEVIGNYTESNSVGILATNGTVQSQSYVIEIGKFFPEVQVSQQACPLWVPLIENNEHTGHGADFFVRKNIHELLAKDPMIDTVLLACTHYPVMLKKIEDYMPLDIKIVSQGAIVAKSLVEYLKRHTKMDESLSKNGSSAFFTTDSAADFNRQAAVFFGHEVDARHVDLG